MGLPDPRYKRRTGPPLTVEELAARRSATSGFAETVVRCEHCGQPYDPFNERGYPVYQYADCPGCGWPRVHDLAERECDCGWENPAVRIGREFARHQNERIMDILTGFG